jgi:hypothetical protein
MYPKEAADFLNEAFGSQGFIVTTKEKEAPRERDARVNNDKARAMFGEFLPVKEGLIAMAQSLIDFGVIKKRD